MKIIKHFSATILALLKETGKLIFYDIDTHFVHLEHFYFLTKLISNVKNVYK